MSGKTIRKIIKGADKGVNICVGIVCILILLMCLYAGYDNYLVYTSADDHSIQQYKPKEDTSAGLKQSLSEDCIAWLTLDDTTIDYPVMQSENDTDYLNKDPYGNYSLSGSIFLDNRNASDFSDPYSLVYGHHMDHGAMFGALDSYLDKDFYNAHRTGHLITEDGTYQITIFAVVDTDASAAVVFDPKSGQDILGYIEKNAVIYDSPVSEHIIGLSTCESAQSTGRLVIYGALTK